MWLDEITGAASGCLPFKFFYGGEDSRTFLGGWGKKNFGSSAKYFEDEKNGGLEITADIKIFGACPAFDLQIKFENTGDADTKAVSGLSTLYFELDCPLPDGSYIIRRANGGLSTKDDFVQSDVVINCGGKHSLAARGGRSSNADLPFFRIDAGRAASLSPWAGRANGDAISQMKTTGSSCPPESKTRIFLCARAKNLRSVRWPRFFIKAALILKISRQTICSGSCCLTSTCLKSRTAAA
ncbi:MAG: hypothetical protein FWE82_01295 [Defluviitaleaceae bacterium]|nr:hypothetical protein [Defluviitaleaceae bacterium]